MSTVCLNFSLRPSDAERELHRKAGVGIVGVMAVILDADNSEKRSIQGLLLQSRAKRAFPCSC